jgi:hypothetical protein
MTKADNLPPTAEVAARARAVLDGHWRPDGYCVPNATVYPFQWLWDSCFHAVAWAHLGEHDRAVQELARVFVHQDELGFVPHVDYSTAPKLHADFWGRTGASSITQPPMYGHAVAELTRCGVELSGRVVAAARRGLQFLLVDRARDPSTDLVTVVHPWETGADNSPRWDHWCGPSFDVDRWFEVKGELMRSIERSPTGAPLANPAFGAAPVGFNALIAFNAVELGWVIGEDDPVVVAGRCLADSLASRWDGQLATWIDAGPSATTSGLVRTLDALLPALVLDDVPAHLAMASLVDPAAHGGPFGPTGVHREEPTFAPDTYWRGSAWPQLSYLSWLAARRLGDMSTGVDIARQLVAGAWKSGFAEHWNPDDASPLGAAPQSWTALATVVDSTMRPTTSRQRSRRRYR